MPIPAAVAIGAQVLPSAIGLFRGLFGKSEEDQFREAQTENLRRMVTAIKLGASTQRARIDSRLKSMSSLAQLSGSRQAASLGYRGSTTSFSAPTIGNLQSGADESLRQIDQNELAQIAGANANFQTQPSYAFPSRLDYLTKATQGIGDYIGLQDQLQLERDRLKRLPVYDNSFDPGKRFLDPGSRNSPLPDRSGGGYFG